MKCPAHPTYAELSSGLRSSCELSRRQARQVYKQSPCCSAKIRSDLLACSAKHGSLQLYAWRSAQSRGSDLFPTGTCLGSLSHKSWLELLGLRSDGSRRCAARRRSPPGLELCYRRPVLPARRGYVRESKAAQRMQGAHIHAKQAVHTH